MRVLVVNAGSSSVKLRVVDDRDALVGSDDLDAPPPGGDDGALAGAIGALGPVDAVGHRIVHGGPRFAAPVRVDDEVVAALGELTELAPLHGPAALAALALARAALPGVPAVACFDTAFHATLPAAAATFALPAAWREAWGLRRYGFHGLSHAYASRRAAAPRVVTCHLGAGASLCAVRDGRSVDTTMGFTPVDGLVMATRSGSIDPGLLAWLVESGRVTATELSDALTGRSGLRGLAGTPDLREVIARADSGDADARLAFDVYVHHLRAGIAAMVASLGGLDALVFTGGVGERSPAVRAAAVAGLGFLGAALDPARNAAAHGDADVTGPQSAARVLVVAAREDLEIARAVRGVLNGGPGAAPSRPPPSAGQHPAIARRRSA